MMRLKFGRKFWMLLRNELMSSRLTLFVFPAAILAWQLFLLSRHGRWPEELMFGLGFLPLGVLPFWALFSGFQTLRAEWAGNSIHTLRSLPVPGWTVITAKLAATGVEYACYMLVTVAGAAVILGRVAAVETPPLQQVPWTMWLSLGFKAGVFYLLLGLGAAITSQLAYLVGRLMGRFQGLLSAAALLLCFWLVGRGSILLSPALEWLPPIRLQSINVVDSVLSYDTVLVSSGPFVAVVLILAAFVLASSSLLERAVDV